MFTHKDIENRTIFVINCIKDRSLRVSNGELLLEEWVEDADKYKTLTKMPFQKMLALFVVGHITVTTPLIEKCRADCREALSTSCVFLEQHSRSELPLATETI